MPSLAANASSMYLNVEKYLRFAIDHSNVMFKMSGRFLVSSNDGPSIT